jgi:hypothetical protein
MKDICKIITLIFVFASSSIFGQHTKYDVVISKFITCVKEKDSKSISGMISFPFRRNYPVPDIKNAKEFIDRYNEIFDDSLQKIIVESDIHKDWSEMGWRGIMLSNGLVWLDTYGRLTRVNYESKYEYDNRIRIINQEKDLLYESIKDFKEPIFVWETKKFKIRVDKLENNTFRYVSWEISKDQNEKPDLILTNGEIVFDGSGGNHEFLFKNGAFEYNCHVIVLGTAASPPGYLIITKNDKQILKEKVIKSIRN